MRNIYLFLFVLSFSFVSNAQIKYATGTFGSGNTMTAKVEINSIKDSVFFEISGPSNKWFAMGFNTTVMSGYAIICNNGGGNPAEYQMNGNGAPAIHTNQNLKNITSSTVGTTKTFKFSRKMTTSDAQDYAFSTSTSTMSIAYAIGNGSTLAQHGTNRGSGSLTFTELCPSLMLDTLPAFHICEGDSSMIFGQYQNSTGFYHNTLYSYLGCDSIITTQYLLVNNLTDTNYSVDLCKDETYDFLGTILSQGGTYSDTVDCKVHNLTLIKYNPESSMVWNPNTKTLDAQIAFVEHQWYNCDTKMEISGATAINYQPSNPGNYALIVSLGSCKDTSECFEVTGDMLNVLENNIPVEIWQDNQRIYFDGITVNKITVYNSLGAEVSQSLETSWLDKKGWVKGIYFLEIESEKGIYKTKIAVK